MRSDRFAEFDVARITFLQLREWGLIHPLERPASFGTDCPCAVLALTHGSPFCNYVEGRRAAKGNQKLTIQRGSHSKTAAVCLKEKLWKKRLLAITFAAAIAMSVTWGQATSPGR